MEIRSGCAGFGEALDVARLYIEKGQYQTAVVIGCEAISPLIVPVFLGKDPDADPHARPHEPVQLRRRRGRRGRAGRATTASGIIGSAMACVGGGRKPGMQIIGAGTHEPVHKQLQAKRLVDLQGRRRRVRQVHALRADRGADRGAARAAPPPRTIDVCLIPEGNAGYMVEELKEAGLLTPEWTALEGKIVENLALVGATGSAAVPLALDHARKTGAVKQGDLVMLLAIETSKWKYAGNVLNWTAA